MDPSSTKILSKEENRQLVDLAFDCLFINEYEREETLNCLDEDPEDEKASPGAIDIFKRENLISNENLEFLIAFHTHLRIRNRDHKFGRIAVANGMTGQEEIDAALDAQKQYFNRNGICVRIGDVLVADGVITHGERISILLTQNRIRTEHLVEAFMDLGKTPGQKQALSKRFGVIAIKHELASRDQVNTALEIQEQEIKENGAFRFIGQILQETAGLASEDVNRVLEIQGQFEKRRLDLEKALYTPHSEIRICKKLNRMLAYKVSRDGTEAYVKKRVPLKEELHVYELLIWFKRIGIRYGIVPDDDLADFFKSAKENTYVCVARGYAPEPSVDESVAFEFEKGVQPEQSEAESATDSDDNDPVEEETADGEGTDEDLVEAETGEEEPVHEDDNLQNDQANTGEVVQKGKVLARIRPGEQGKPGKDVFGYPVYAAQPGNCDFRAGRGVVRRGNSFVARIDGRVQIKHGNTLTVETMEEKSDVRIIAGDITDDTGDTYSHDKVDIRGDITGDGRLTCRSLLLHGKLTGTVICTGDVELKGNMGIPAAQDGKTTVRGSALMAFGSVRTDKPIVNSIVETAGELMGFHSTVEGSRIIACRGITVEGVLGGDQGPSTLRFGLKPGDKMLAIDDTLEAKRGELSVLKKDAAIAELTGKYMQDLDREAARRCEQAMIENLVEILTAPELDQIDGLENKILHLQRLPEFSSIRAYYLKLPDTDAARVHIGKIVDRTRKMGRDEILEHLEGKLDPAPEEETALSGVERIETEFRARLAALEQEVSEQSATIESLEQEVLKLSSLREKLAAVEVKCIPRSESAVYVRNTCEKGTVIHGRIARFVLGETVYHSKFTEAVHPKTNEVFIAIDSC